MPAILVHHDQAEFFFDVGPLVEFLLLANVATQFEDPLEFDPLACTIVNHPEADAALLIGDEARSDTYPTMEIGDHIFVNHSIGFSRFLAPFTSNSLFFLPQLVGLISQRRRFFEILVGDSLLFVLVQALDLFVEKTSTLTDK